MGVKSAVWRCGKRVHFKLATGLYPEGTGTLSGYVLSKHPCCRDACGKQQLLCTEHFLWLRRCNTVFSEHESGNVLVVVGMHTALTAVCKLLNRLGLGKAMCIHHKCMDCAGD